MFKSLFTNLRHWIASSRHCVVFFWFWLIPKSTSSIGIFSSDRWSFLLVLPIWNLDRLCGEKLQVWDRWSLDERKFRSLPSTSQRLFPELLMTFVHKRGVFGKGAFELTLLSAFPDAGFGNQRCDRFISYFWCCNDLVSSLHVLIGSHFIFPLMLIPWFTFSIVLLGSFRIALLSSVILCSDNFFSGLIPVVTDSLNSCRFLPDRKSVV